MLLVLPIVTVRRVLVACSTTLSFCTEWLALADPRDPWRNRIQIFAHPLVRDPNRELGKKLPRYSPDSAVSYVSKGGRSDATSSFDRRRAVVQLRRHDP